MNDQLPIPGLVLPPHTPVTTGGARGYSGLRGERGITGIEGPTGPIGNFNLTDAPFVVPDAGTRVVVTMQDASWASVGEMVYIEWAGENGESAIFEVVAVQGRRVTLLNPRRTMLGEATAQPFRYLFEETILSARDNGWYFLCTGGEWTLHLPPPESGLFYFIRNDMDLTDGLITLEPASGQINQAPSFPLFPGQACRLFTDGTDWRTCGLRGLPFIIAEPSDNDYDLIFAQLWPDWPCLSLSYRGQDRRTLYSGDGWLGFLRGGDPDDTYASYNPAYAGWIGMSDDDRLWLESKTTIQMTKATINGRLTVPTGGAHITGSVTTNSQGDWTRINSGNPYGILTDVYDDRPVGGSSIYKEMFRANPHWDDCTLRCWHYTGYWIAWSLMFGYSQRFDLRWDSNISRSDGAIIQFVASDARNKKDIGPPEADALEILRRIPIQAYTHIKDGIRRAVGWVAQSVEKVLPDWVQETKAPGPDGQGVEVYKRVEPNDQGLPYLIRAIQQLDQRLDRIEARITELEAE